MSSQNRVSKGVPTGGQFAASAKGEPSLSVGLMERVTSTGTYTDFDTTFTEGGEFTPISDGETERGMVAVISAQDVDGNDIQVVSQLAISQDEDGRWWQVYSDRQTVTTPDGDMYEKELGVGNVESVTFADEDSAWASLQQARGSLSFEHHHSVGNFEVSDLDDYEAF